MRFRAPVRTQSHLGEITGRCGVGAARAEDCAVQLEKVSVRQASALLCLIEYTNIPRERWEVSSQLAGGRGTTFSRVGGDPGVIVAPWSVKGVHRTAGT